MRGKMHQPRTPISAKPMGGFLRRQKQPCSRVARAALLLNLKGAHPDAATHCSHPMAYFHHNLEGHGTLLSLRSMNVNIDLIRCRNGSQVSRRDLVGCAIGSRTCIIAVVHHVWTGSSASIDIRVVQTTKPRGLDNRRPETKNTTKCKIVEHALLL